MTIRNRWKDLIKEVTEWEKVSKDERKKGSYGPRNERDGTEQLPDQEISDIAKRLKNYRNPECELIISSGEQTLEHLINKARTKWSTGQD